MLASPWLSLSLWSGDWGLSCSYIVLDYNVGILVVFSLVKSVIMLGQSFDFERFTCVSLKILSLNLNAHCPPVKCGMGTHIV